MLLNYFYTCICMTGFLKLYYCQQINANAADDVIGKKYVVYFVQSPFTKRDSDTWLCGGALVSPTQILTAAACLVEAENIYAIAGYNKYVGPKDIEKDECTSRKKQRVVKILVPTEYRLTTENPAQWINVDVGVAIVEKPYNFNDFTYRIYCSYEPQPIYVNFEDKYEMASTHAVALGWGSSVPENEQINSHVLQESSTVIVDKTVCANTVNTQEIIYIIEKYLLCASGNVENVTKKTKGDESKTNCTVRRYDLSRALNSNGCVEDDFRRHDENKNNTDQEKRNDQKNTYTDTKNDTHENYLYTSLNTRRSTTSSVGLCQSGHGCPLIRWVGDKEIVIGVASNSNKNDECKGPFLYVSTAATSNIIKCLLETNSMTRKFCNQEISDKRYEVEEIDISWPDNLLKLPSHLPMPIIKRSIPDDIQLIYRPTVDIVKDRLQPGQPYDPSLTQPYAQRFDQHPPQTYETAQTYNQQPHSQLDKQRFGMKNVPRTGQINEQQLFASSLRGPESAQQYEMLLRQQDNAPLGQSLGQQNGSPSRQQYIPASDPPLEQQYDPSPGQQYDPPPEQKYDPPAGQLYDSPPEQKYDPPAGQLYDSSPERQYDPPAGQLYDTLPEQQYDPPSGSRHQYEPSHEQPYDPLSRQQHHPSAEQKYGSPARQQYEVSPEEQYEPQIGQAPPTGQQNGTPRSHHLSQDQQYVHQPKLQYDQHLSQQNELPPKQHFLPQPEQQNESLPGQQYASPTVQQYKPPIIQQLEQNGGQQYVPPFEHQFKRSLSLSEPSGQQYYPQFHKQYKHLPPLVDAKSGQQYESPTGQQYEPPMSQRYETSGRQQYVSPFEHNRSLLPSGLSGQQYYPQFDKQYDLPPRSVDAAPGQQYESLTNQFQGIMAQQYDFQPTPRQEIPIGQQYEPYSKQTFNKRDARPQIHIFRNEEQQKTQELDVPSHDNPYMTYQSPSKSSPEQKQRPYVQKFDQNIPFKLYQEPMDNKKLSEQMYPPRNIPAETPSQIPSQGREETFDHVYSHLHEPSFDLPHEINVPQYNGPPDDTSDDKEQASDALNTQQSATHAAATEQNNVGFRPQMPVDYQQNYFFYNARRNGSSL